MTSAESRVPADGRSLLIISFAGSANRGRGAAFIQDVLFSKRLEPLDGLVLDFRQVRYVYGNNDTFSVLWNYLNSEKRFVRVVIGEECQSGLAGLMHVYPQFFVPTVESAAEQFTAVRSVV